MHAACGLQAAVGQYPWSPRSNIRPSNKRRIRLKVRMAYRLLEAAVRSKRPTILFVIKMRVRDERYFGRRLGICFTEPQVPAVRQSIGLLQCANALKDSVFRMSCLVAERDSLRVAKQTIQIREEPSDVRIPFGLSDNSLLQRKDSWVCQTQLTRPVLQIVLGYRFRRDAEKRIF